MDTRRGLGFSSVESMSTSQPSWKQRIGKVAIFLCLLMLVGLLFTFISGATHPIGSKAASPDSPEAGWDVTTQ